MIALATLIVIVTGENATVFIRRESGTAFVKSDEKTYFYWDSRNVQLNILRPSPRFLLNEDDYKYSDQTEKDYCEFLFDTFDFQIAKFFEFKLVKELRTSVLENKVNECPDNKPNPYFEGKWCCSSTRELAKPKNENWAKEWGIKKGECDGSVLTLKSKCCDGSAVECKQPPCETSPNKPSRKSRSTRIHPHAELNVEQQKSIPNSTDPQQSNQFRHRRAIPVIAQFAVVIGTAVSAYFLGESVVESDLKNMKDEIHAEEEALKSLTRAVKLDHSTLSSVVHQLKISPDLVLAPNVTTLSPTYAYMKAMTNGPGFKFFYANHIAELAEAEVQTFESNVLQLQNNRLPLNKEFLIAVRAKCLSLQSVEAAIANLFCNDLAFHATRWNTGLKFTGVGFEYNSSKKVKSTVYSLTLNIPILHAGGLPEYIIINLGRFQTENIIRKIALPEKAVITASGDIRPLHDHECLKMDSYKVCPKSAIAPYNNCLQSVMRGNISEDCVAGDYVSPSTCTSQQLDSFMAISMFGNGTMHFDLGKAQHHKKPVEIDSYTFMQRQKTRGTLFCKQSKHRHISPDLELPAATKMISSSLEVNQIRDTYLDLSHLTPVSANVANLDKRLDAAEKQLIETENTLLTAHNNTHSVVTEFKDHIASAVDKVKKDVNNVFNSIVMNVVLPIMLPPICIAFMSLIAWTIFKKWFQKSNGTGPNSSSILEYEHGNSRQDNFPLTTNQ